MHGNGTGWIGGQERENWVRREGGLGMKGRGFKDKVHAAAKHAAGSCLVKRTGRKCLTFPAPSVQISLTLSSWSSSVSRFLGQVSQSFVSFPFRRHQGSPGGVGTGWKPAGRESIILSLMLAAVHARPALLNGAFPASIPLPRGIDTFSVLPLTLAVPLAFPS
ncbi:hypothetical protein R1flu_011333 [Riccia fluitans]|uniref:Uncharacterized protein n=1 Tax=Riccia fluitans TaxID=41844 RepID=A0ABD1Z7H5_9MARC